jgi:hypothetical protein
VLSRAFAWAAAALAFLLVAPDRSANGDHLAGVVDVGWPVDVWGNWDGAWYADIAERGYARASSPAFFPLYPFLARALGWLLGGHVLLAAVIVSLAACLASFVLLHRLTLDLAGPAVADRAVLYLAVFPASLFLQAAYAESLFLLLALATFMLAERGRFAWAGAACGGALLTRPAGIALLAALVAFAARRPDRRRGLAAVALAVGVSCLYPLLLWWQRGDPLAFAAAQQHWGRHFSPLGPLVAGIESALDTILLLVSVLSPPPMTKSLAEFRHAAVNNLIAQLFLVMFIALLIAVYRRFGPRSPYFVYAAVSLALPLCSPIAGNPLLSLPRFGLVIFPLFIVLAIAGRARRAVHLAYVTSSAALLGVAAAAFALYVWVA